MEELYKENSSEKSYSSDDSFSLDNYSLDNTFNEKSVEETNNLESSSKYETQSYSSSYEYEPRSKQSNRRHSDYVQNREYSGEYYDRPQFLETAKSFFQTTQRIFEAIRINLISEQALYRERVEKLTIPQDFTTYDKVVASVGFFEMHIGNGGDSFWSGEIPPDASMEYCVYVATIATRRALVGSNLIRIENIVKGVAYGRYSIMRPNGTFHIETFHNERAYSADATFLINREEQTFKIYYRAKCFNLVKSNPVENVDNSNITFIPDSTKKKEIVKTPLIINKRMKNGLNKLRVNAKKIEKRQIKLGNTTALISEKAKVVSIESNNGEAFLRSKIENGERGILDDIFYTGEYIEYNGTKIYLIDEGKQVGIEWSNGLIKQLKIQ